MSINDKRELESIKSLLYDTMMVITDILIYDSSRLPLNNQFDKIILSIERYWADY